MTAILVVIIILATISVSSLFLIKRTRHQFRSKLEQATSAMMQAQEAEKKLQEEMKQLQAKLTTSTQDPVTHLPSWELFEDRLNQSVKESLRHQLIMAVLLVDIDDFKSINNALNYKIGNALLMQVAERINACLRQVDSVSRFTKDTFVVLVTQLNKPEMAAIVAQRILQTFNEPFEVEGQAVHVTVGIGIALLPTDGQDVPTLLRSAGHALHLAKTKGRHRYQFFQEEMHSHSQRDLQLVNAFNNDDIFKEFSLQYQPMINTADNSIICLSSVLCWQHQTLGLISEQEILSLAERQRKLPALIEWMLHYACNQYIHWQSIGFKPKMLSISLPIKLLENSQMVYRISQILQEMAFKPENLLLELSTNHAVLSYDILEKSFNMLRYVGIKFALKNYGSSSVTLQQLKYIPTDFLMLDPFLIDDLETNPRTAELVKSAISLAKNLSVKIIAQGVTTRRQMALLQEIGCYDMQGQFVAPTMTDSDIENKKTTFS